MRPTTRYFFILLFFYQSLCLATSIEDTQMSYLFSLSLEELLNIKVTAQKREENINDVPLSIRVINNSQIQRANITRISELSHISSSLVYDKRIGFTKSSIKIRGIGTQVFGAGVEPSVATMVDGVVMARGGAGFGDLVDIERIEILYGSQSTLFGKNASAGLIHIITPLPSTDKNINQVDSRITDDNEQLLSYLSSGPINSKLAYRFSAQAREYQGNVINLYNKNDLNGYDTQSAKVKLLWQSTNGSRWLFSSDYSKQDSSAGVRVLRRNSDTILTDPAAVGVVGVAATAGDITGIEGSDDNREVNLDRDPFANTTAWGISLNTQWQLGIHSISNILAYREWQQDSNRDNDQTQLPFSLSQTENRDVKWVSEELRMTSELQDKYDYVIGLYYYQSEIKDNSGDDRTLSNSPYVVEFNQAQNTIQNRNIALFGQVNLHLTDSLSAFFGTRFLYDKITGKLSRVAHTQNNSFLADGQITSVRNVAGIKNQNSITAVTGRTGLKLNMRENIMAYGSYSRGFKGEGFNTSFKFSESVFLGDEPVSAETSDTLELGVKSYLLDNAMRFNASIFYTQFHDLQLTVRDLENNRNILGSVPEVISQGVEVDFSMVVANDINIEGAVSYIDAYYADFTNANCFSGQTQAQGCIGNSQNLTGHTLANTPKWKSSLSVRYDFTLMTKNIFIDGNWRMQSKVNLDAAGNDGAQIGAYNIIDAGVGFIWGNKLSGKLFVNNLFDKKYINGITINGNAGGDLLMHLVPRDFGRFMGAALKFKF